MIYRCRQNYFLTFIWQLQISGYICAVKAKVKRIAQHPGEHIYDILKLSGMSQRELADQIGWLPPHVNALIKGKRHVSASLAIKLENILGLTAKKWMDAQVDYDLETVRLGQTVRRRIK